MGRKFEQCLVYPHLLAHALRQSEVPTALFLWDQVAEADRDAVERNLYDECSGLIPSWAGIDDKTRSLWGDSFDHGIEGYLFVSAFHLQNILCHVPWPPMSIALQKDRRRCYCPRCE